MPAKKAKRSGAAPKAAAGRFKARKASAGSSRSNGGKTRSKPAGADALFEHLKRDVGAVRDVFARELDTVVESARKAVDKSGITDRERLKQMEARMKDGLETAREKLDDAQTRIAEAARKMHDDERVQSAADAGF